jgi:hypothetical protein
LLFIFAGFLFIGKFLFIVMDTLVDSQNISAHSQSKVS